MAAQIGRPATTSQRLIWTGQKLDPEAPLYNMAVAFRVDGAIDATRFRAAFQALTDNCDTLRTVFRESAGELEQVVLPELRVEVEVADFTGQSPEALDAELLRRTHRVFQPGRPLFESTLFQVGAEQFVWFLNQHHLTTDATSTGILFRSMSELYQSGANSLEMPQYADYVEHERALAGSPQAEKAAAYWREGSLADEAPTRVYGQGLDSNGKGRTARVRRPFGAGRNAALKEITGQAPFQALTASQSRFQIFATLLLAWAHRVTDRTANSIGTPSHGRGTAKFRRTAGLFMELFPIRATIDEGETFASLAKKVAHGAYAITKHGHPGASGTPEARDYSFVLNFITAKFGEFAGMPTKADWVHSGFGDPNHRMRLQVYDFDMSGELTLDFDLDKNVFGEVETRWAIEHFFRLADALIADPDQSIADVPLVTGSELEELQPTGPITARAEDVLTRIERHAAQNPAKAAVVEGERTVSYAELEELTARAAAAVPAGAGVVGVCLPRSAELIATWLGALRAGAAYLPLDPGYPDRRLRFMLEDAGAAAVLTDCGNADRFRDLGLEVVDVATSEAAEKPSTALDPAPDDLAYILYTSGSTGSPKGVCISRGALADYVDFACRSYLDDRPARFAFFTSPAFDLTVTSVFAPLAGGGTVVVFSEQDGAAAVRRVFSDDRCDIVKLTPSHLALVRDLDLEDCGITKLILGGEDLKAELAAEIHRMLGGRATIWNEYGPTEATVGCMIHRWDPETETTGSVSIGRPADNARIYVLDSNLRPVPRGVRGQICIAGRGLAGGYRNRPELTSERFVADPFRSGERMYLSGDVGRWDSAGRLEFLGRRDEQVKLHGVRVELGEVEAALASHTEIAKCAVKLVSASAADEPVHCRRCGLESLHPEAQIGENGLCAVCVRFEAEKELVDSYFRDPAELETALAEAKTATEGPHDCLMLYSGGKDSTYALCQIVEMGAKPLVFLLDNGYISDQAFANVRRVVEKLGLEMVIGRTPAMPEIFADSLQRFSNVCNGCFKTVYTLAMNLAHERGIRHIITGLSRGQLLETRLADLLRRRIYDPKRIDATILEARKTYHRVDDAVSRNLDVEIFEDDRVLDAIEFVDFYRYRDVPLDEVLRYIGEHTPWIRPDDTGRSTNCRINEAGIYVHKAERGFHNYSEPYSWDVRLGHKTREEALAELDDRIDVPVVQGILREVGYRSRPRGKPVGLAAYYVSEHRLNPTELRRFLSASLPAEHLPTSFVRLDSMPLTQNGKVDRAALPQAPVLPAAEVESVFVAPRNEREQLLAEAWCEIMGLAEVSIDADFFELGGDSMQCIQIVALAGGHGLTLTPRELFANPTIRALAPLARAAETAVPAAASPTGFGVSSDELQDVLDELGEA